MFLFLFFSLFRPFYFSQFHSFICSHFHSCSRPCVIFSHFPSPHRYKSMFLYHFPTFLSFGPFSRSLSSPNLSHACSLPDLDMQYYESPLHFLISPLSRPSPAFVPFHGLVLMLVDVIAPFLFSLQIQPSIALDFSLVYDLRLCIFHVFVMELISFTYQRNNLVLILSLTPVLLLIILFPAFKSSSFLSLSLSSFPFLTSVISPHFHSRTNKNHVLVSAFLRFDPQYSPFLVFFSCLF